MTSPLIMKAILAMDSYNRGYGAGIEGLGGIGQGIGYATIIQTSAILGQGADQNIGFFASAYTYNGETVISYRGTDRPFSLTALDTING